MRSRKSWESCLRSIPSPILLLLFCLLGFGAQGSLRFLVSLAVTFHVLTFVQKPKLISWGSPEADPSSRQLERFELELDISCRLAALS